MSWYIGGTVYNEKVNSDVFPGTDTDPGETKSTGVLASSILNVVYFEKKKFFFY